MTVRRAWSEGLLLFILAFGPVAFGCVEPWSLAILEIAIFTLAIFCALRRNSPSLEPMHWNTIPSTYRTLLPALLAVLLLGLIQRLHPVAPGSPHTLLPFTASSYGTSQALLLWCAFAALVWSVPKILDGPDVSRRFVWTLFLLGSLIAMAGIIQDSQGNAAIYGLRELRPGRNPFGPYYNRDHAASFMAMCALVGSGLFISRFASLKGGKNVGMISDLAATQALVLFLLSILLYGIIKTGSRGALHSMFLSVWITAFLSSGFLHDRHYVWAARSGLALAAAGYVAFICAFPESVGFIWTDPDGSTAKRLSMYRSGFEMFKDFPLFGVGLGSFISIFPAYQEGFLKGTVEHVHSDWLELFLQTGIFGGVLFILGLAFLASKALKTWKDCPSLEMRCLLGGAMAATLAFTIQAFVEFSFQIPANAVTFLILIVLIASYSPRDKSTAPSAMSKPTFMPHIAVGALCVGLVALIAFATRPAVAYWYVYRAEKAPPSSQPYFLNKAFQWDSNPDTLHRMGTTYLKLAVSNPPAGLLLLRQGLDYSSKAIQADPLNQRFRHLQGALLSRLGRTEDSADFINTKE